MLPIVSIIVPVYNVEKYLDKCIESLLNQTLREIEIILVDDGSPDRCGQICDEYAQKDKRIRVIHKNNGGISSARNAGLEYVKGTYIGFVDSDDSVDRHMFEFLVKSAEKSNADITICGYQNVLEDGSFISILSPQEQVINMNDLGISKYIINHYLTFEHAFCNWNRLYKKDFVNKYNLRFEEEHSYAEDMLFNLYSICHANRISIIPNPLYNYVRKSESLSQVLPDDILIRLVNLVETFEIYVKKYNVKNITSGMIAVVFWYEIISALTSLARSMDENELTKKLKIVGENPSFKRYMRTCFSCKEYVSYIERAGYTRKGKYYMKFIMFLYINRCYSLATKIIKSFNK
ncbi:glycosyltransferase [Bacillus sp. S13(2024)]|uniref:glycosyltransferase family 2 protein n=1 Tax=unclassified Bacillus (in: firmicutes) TaxID=185979 RepID=UPI003D1D3655